MPTRCVVAGCSYYPNREKSIALHPIPFLGDESSKAKKRRRRWVNFVRLKRDKWVPTKWSCICSNHFTQESFSKIYPATSSTPRLIRDDFGVLAHPTIQSVKKETLQEKTTSGRPMSTWRRKRIVKELESQYQLDIPTESEPVVGPCLEPSATPDEEAPYPELFEAMEDKHEDAVENIAIGTKDAKVHDCVECNKLLKQNRISKNRIISLRMLLRRYKKEKQMLLRKIRRLWKKNSPQKKIEASSAVEIDSETDSDDDEMLIEENELVEEEDEQYEPSDSETESDSDDAVDQEHTIFQANDGNLRTEPKYIVFLKHLLMLFRFCHYCKAENPFLEVTQSGTMITIKSCCIDPKCRKENIWHSQPKMTGTRTPAGNFLLSFATLVAGGSITKVLQIFKHMGLATISLATFFKHQRVYKIYIKGQDMYSLTLL